MPGCACRPYADPNALRQACHIEHVGPRRLSKSNIKVGRACETNSHSLPPCSATDDRTAEAQRESLGP